MRNWLCIFDFNRTTSIWSISEPLLILILAEGFFHISLYQHLVSSVILMVGFFNLHIRKRSHVSHFLAYNLYLHISQFIISGIPIFIRINSTRIEKFLPFYISIIKVSGYLLPALLHPTKNSEKYGINISTIMIGSYMNYL